jgi:hypothetical protein
MTANKTTDGTHGFDGKYVAISKPSYDGTPLAEPENLERLRSLCADAGFSGAMPGVLEMLTDRGDDENGRYSRILARLDHHSIADGYIEHIGPAVDRIEDALTEPDDEVLMASYRDLDEHIQKICDEADLGGVMPGILEIVFERNDSDDMKARMEALTANDVSVLYQDVVAPAIEDWCDELASSN